MSPTDQLNLFIDEYLKETDKKRIQNISLSIPGHIGDFWIIDSMSLSFDLATLTFEQLESFSLAIYFSFSDKGKKGVFLTDRITKSECFKDFTVRSGSRLKVYFKDKYIDKMEIVEKVKVIVLSLFPDIEFNEILIRLNRLDNWMTIEENGSA